MKLDYHGGSYLFANYSLKIINGTRNILLVYFTSNSRWKLSLFFTSSRTEFNVSESTASSLYSELVKLTLKSPFEKRSAVAERFLIPEEAARSNRTPATD